MLTGRSLFEIISLVGERDTDEGDDDMTRTTYQIKFQGRPLFLAIEADGRLRWTLEFANATHFDREDEAICTAARVNGLVCSQTTVIPADNPFARKAHRIAVRRDCGRCDI